MKAQQKKYPVLRIVSTCSVIIAWLVLLMTVFGIFAYIDYLESFVLAIPPLIIGVIIFLFFIILPEVIQLFIDIEENTRKSIINNDE